MAVLPEEMLKKLVAATAEAKETIRELHEARAVALDVDRKQRERITQAIVTEVERQVGELADEARTEMRETISNVIKGFSELWREKLGL